MLLLAAPPIGDARLPLVLRCPVDGEAKGEKELSRETGIGAPPGVAARAAGDDDELFPPVGAIGGSDENDRAVPPFA